MVRAKTRFGQRAFAARTYGQTSDKQETDTDQLIVNNIKFLRDRWQSMKKVLRILKDIRDIPNILYPTSYIHNIPHFTFCISYPISYIPYFTSYTLRSISHISVQYFTSHILYPQILNILYSIYLYSSHFHV